jgi:hypothetical protein
MMSSINKINHQSQHSLQLGAFDIGFQRTSIPIINYPNLSAAIWGLDWMDGSSAFWMSFPFWELFQMWNVLMDLVDF